MPGSYEERGTISGLPAGWVSDYDGIRWFYTYQTTGHTQYHFPKEGDEFSEFFDALAPMPDLALDEKFEPGYKKTAKGDSLPAGLDVKKTTAAPRIRDSVWGDGEGGFGKTLFRPESFMYLGPAAFTDVSPLVEEEEDETARKTLTDKHQDIVTTGIPKNRKVASVVVQTEIVPESARWSPANMDTSAGDSEKAKLPAITIEPVTIPAAREHEAQWTDATAVVPGPLTLSGQHKAQQGLPAAEQRLDPVGVVPEMATEYTAPAYAELHPEPVELGDNSVLASVETAARPGSAELPGQHNAAKLAAEAGQRGLSHVPSVLQPAKRGVSKSAQQLSLLATPWASTTVSNQQDIVRHPSVLQPARGRALSQPAKMIMTTTTEVPDRREHVVGDGSLTQDEVMQALRSVPTQKQHPRGDQSLQPNLDRAANELSNNMEDLSFGTFPEQQSEAAGSSYDQHPLRPARAIPTLLLEAKPLVVRPYTRQYGSSYSPQSGETEPSTAASSPYQKLGIMPYTPPGFHAFPSPLSAGLSPGMPLQTPSPMSATLGYPSEASSQEAFPGRWPGHSSSASEPIAGAVLNMSGYSPRPSLEAQTLGAASDSKSMGNSSVPGITHSNGPDLGYFPPQSDSLVSLSAKSSSSNLGGSDEESQKRQSSSSAQHLDITRPSSHDTDLPARLPSPAGSADQGRRSPWQSRFLEPPSSKPAVAEPSWAEKEKEDKIDIWQGTTLFETSSEPPTRSPSTAPGMYPSSIVTSNTPGRLSAEGHRAPGQEATGARDVAQRRHSAWLPSPALDAWEAYAVQQCEAPPSEKWSHARSKSTPDDPATQYDHTLPWSWPHQWTPTTPKHDQLPPSQQPSYEWMATQGLTPLNQLQPSQKPSAWAAYMSTTKMQGLKPAMNSIKPGMVSAQTAISSLAGKSKNKLTKLRKPNKSMPIISAPQQMAVGASMGGMAPGLGMYGSGQDMWGTKSYQLHGIAQQNTEQQTAILQPPAAFGHRKTASEQLGVPRAGPLNSHPVQAQEHGGERQMLI